MTDTSAAQATADSDVAPDDGAGCRQTAARLRSQHPRWVIIWLPDQPCYRAWPLFRAPRGTVLTAQAPDDLAAKMEQAEQADGSPRARSRRMDT